MDKIQPFFDKTRRKIIRFQNLTVWAYQDADAENPKKIFQAKMFHQ